MKSNRYEAMTQALRQADYRLTPQRLAICRHLAETDTHPGPGDVYEFVHQQYPTISLATVYNTLAVLRDLGEIIEISGGGDGVRYEADLTPHVNLVCLRCGSITDLPAPGLENFGEEITAKADFELRGLRVDGFGLCPACRAEEKQPHD